MNIREQFKADAIELDRQRKLCTDAAYELRDGIEVDLGWLLTFEFEMSHRFEPEDIDVLKRLVDSHLTSNIRRR